VDLFCAGDSECTGSATAHVAKPEGFRDATTSCGKLIKAAAVYDVPELTAIFGPDGEDLISSADPVRDKNNAAAFAKEASAIHTVKMDPSKPNLATVIVGHEHWPLPVPLVRKNGKWYFDAKSGRQEILFRRIGANELDAIQVCRGRSPEGIRIANS
jgi:hypothetical protein